MYQLSRGNTGRRALWLAALLVALVAAFQWAAVRPADAARPYDWRIQSSAPVGSTVWSGSTSYRLTNLTINQVLAYGSREYGINLVWQTPAGQHNIRFDRAGGGAIRYGDRVAIRVSNGGYLKYQVREYGINLGWSSTPVYEWEIRGGATGQSVRVGDTVALQNTAILRAMVYGTRDYGINLVWY
jgi:hypothetical protein